MKKLLAFFLIAASVGLAQDPRSVQLTQVQSSGGFTAASGIIIDGPTKKIAAKFYASSTLAIKAIDFYDNITGDITGITGVLSIQSDSSDSPDGTPLGAATAAFALPAADGFTGLKTLGSNTGTLTLNAGYWVVLEDGGGTAPTASNYSQAMYSSAGTGKLKQWNGSTWSAATAGDGIFVLQLSDDSYIGLPFTSTLGGTSQTAVYGTNRQGLRFQVGAQAKISGVYLYLSKIGSPVDLEVSLYEGDSLKETVTITAATISNAVIRRVYFSAPITVAAATNLYIIMHQAGDGGSGSAAYYFQRFLVNSTYMAAVATSDWRMVKGTSGTPSALTVIDTEFIGRFAPMIQDFPNGLVAGSSGGAAACGTVY